MFNLRRCGSGEWFAGEGGTVTRETGLRKPTPLVLCLTSRRASQDLAKMVAELIIEYSTEITSH